MTDSLALFNGAKIGYLILVAARSKALVCGRSPVGITGSNPTGGMDFCILECCV